MIHTNKTHDSMIPEPRSIAQLEPQTLLKNVQIYKEDGSWDIECITC